VKFTRRGDEYHSQRATTFGREGPRQRTGRVANDRNIFMQPSQTAAKTHTNTWPQPAEVGSRQSQNLKIKCGKNVKKAMGDTKSTITEAYGVTPETFVTKPGFLGQNEVSETGGKKQGVAGQKDSETEEGTKKWFPG